MANIVEDEIIKAEMQDALHQVDENLMIDEFNCVFDASARTLKVHFTARNAATEETVVIDNAWG